ncbi:MAG: response regulator [Ginsengibacter sp.]
MDKVLVVDDDQDILSVVKILLTMHHFAVHTISKPELIRNEIENFSPDLILLDISLGGVDGRKICKELKSSDKTSGTPVVLFSAHPDLANNLMGCMANDIVTKPFDSGNLVATLRANLANRSN